MGKSDKLAQKILSGKSDIKPSEVRKILLTLGYSAQGPAGGSSHLTYRKINRDSITVVLTQNPVKPYIIQKVQKALKAEGY